MYVCVCNAYRESQVRDAINKSATTGRVTAEQVYARLGKHPQCGRCVVYVTNLISDADRQKTSRVDPI